MKKQILFFTFLFFACLNLNVYSIDKDSKEFLFLKSINDLKAEYLQQTFNGDETIESAGRIVIKKPNSMLLEDNNEKMKLKIVSVNGNTKIVDKDLGQTTYFDNKYTESVSDLLKFFTGDIKPEMLNMNKKGEICLPFKSFEQPMEACLKIDLRRNKVQHIVVYALVEEELKNKVEKNKIIKKYRTMNILFTKVQINKGVNDEEFFVKDNRIFGDD